MSLKSAFKTGFTRTEFRKIDGNAKTPMMVAALLVAAVIAGWGLFMKFGRTGATIEPVDGSAETQAVYQAVPVTAAEVKAKDVKPKAKAKAKAIAASKKPQKRALTRGAKAKPVAKKHQKPKKPVKAVAKAKHKAKAVAHKGKGKGKAKGIAKKPAKKKATSSRAADKRTSGPLRNLT